MKEIYFYETKEKKMIEKKNNIKIYFNIILYIKY